MVEPVTLAAVAAKWGPWIAEAAGKAIVGELAKSFFFGSDKKKLRKALAEISAALARIEKKLDQIYILVEDIRKSVEQIKSITLQIPDLTNTKKAHADFAAILSGSSLTISSEYSDDGNPGKDTTLLKSSFEDLRRARDVYIRHRQDLAEALHSSSLDILMFFYSDLQVTIAFVNAIWGDGKDYEIELKNYLSEFAGKYEPILEAITNADNNGSLDIHLDKLKSSLEQIVNDVRPYEDLTVLTWYFDIWQKTSLDGEGEPSLFAWEETRSMMIASKSNDAALLGGRILIGVDWLQFLHTIERNQDKGGVTVKKSLSVVAQSRMSAGDGEFKPTALSGAETEDFLRLHNAIAKVASPSLPLSASSEFLLKVEKHNTESAMAAMLEDLRAKVRAALSIINEDDFLQAYVSRTLRAAR